MIGIAGALGLGLAQRSGASAPPHPPALLLEQGGYLLLENGSLLLLE